ncbi:MAG: helix-turn-helix domain-containing protein [Chloroflexi bacterium]|nr:helix-turn-helix domain-containing protein [Chloroflexota bacterium]
MASSTKAHDQKVDVRELGAMLRARRHARRLTLRQVQDELDNSLTASSLSRLENGAVPDARNVQLLASWLGFPVSQVAWPGEAEEPETPMDIPDVVEVHLRANKKLDPAAAEYLAWTFRRLYEDAVSGNVPVVTRRR